MGATPNENGKTIPIQQVLEQQFLKVGKMQWEIDMLKQMLSELEAENKRLKDETRDLPGETGDTNC